MREINIINHQIWVFTCFNRSFQTNSCGKCWLKPGFTEFQTGLGGQGPVQSWLSPCRCFSSLAVDILEIHGRSLTSAKISESKYVDICNFSPDLIKFHQWNIRISSIYHGYSVILDVGNIHEIHHLMFFIRMTCDAGGLRETFWGMMVASSRPWFDKAMTIDPLAHWPIGGTRVAEVLPSQNADEKPLSLAQDQRLQLQKRHRRPLRQVTSFDMFWLVLTCFISWVNAKPPGHWMVNSDDMLNQFMHQCG